MIGYCLRLNQIIVLCTPTGTPASRLVYILQLLLDQAGDPLLDSLQPRTLPEEDVVGRDLSRAVNWSIYPIIASFL